MSNYIAPILRWWWLILLATGLAGISSWITLSRQPPVYEVKATLVIGRSFSNPNPNSNELYLEQQLATVYANLGMRSQMASATMKALGLNALPEYYVYTVTNTPLIEIAVSDIDPGRAVAVANELANQMIKTSPSAKGQQDIERQQFIEDQLKKIQEQIKVTEADIVSAQEKMGNLTSARQIADAQTQIASLQQKLISLQGNYSNLLAGTQEGSVNTIALVQAAEMPGGPVGPNKLMYIALAAGLGLVCSSLAAYGLEFIDNTFKSQEEIVESIKLPVLGSIPKISSNANHWTFASQFPRSPVADAFRTLRTNIEFIQGTKELKTILIVGPDLSMGKSVIATNLALIFSQSEKSVILLDTDLRKPQLSTALHVSGNSGVSEICAGKGKVEKSMIQWSNGNNHNSELELGKINSRSSKPVIDEMYQPSNHGIRFLPAGTIPPNPVELLASTKFESLLSDLKGMADLVILDSPPLFLPDASVLLGKTDGAIMVVELGHTRRNAIKNAMTQIERSGANLIGIVLNRTGESPGYYEKYSSYGKQKKKPE